MNFRMEFLNEDGENDNVELANNIKRELQSQINNVEEEFSNVLFFFCAQYKIIEKVNNSKTCKKLSQYNIFIVLFITTNK